MSYVQNMYTDVEMCKETADQITLLFSVVVVKRISFSEEQ